MGSAARFVAALGFLSFAFLYEPLSSLDSAFALAPKLFLATSFGTALWITFINGIANSRDLMGNTTERLNDVIAWVKAEIPDVDTFLSVEIQALHVAPLILVLVSTYVTIFKKQGLLEYELMLRFSLEFGRPLGCIYVAAFIFLRPFKHLILTQIILLLLGWASAYMFYLVFHGYFIMISKHYYERCYREAQDACSAIQ